MPSQLIERVGALGQKLGFEVAFEVKAAESAWVDVVWFDRRLSPSTAGLPGMSTRESPVLPIVGFEVELRTGLNAKHIKGSASNLTVLGAQMGVIILGAENFKNLGKKSPHASKSPLQLEKVLMDRVYRWIYAESQPGGRIVTLSERQFADWEKRAGSSP